MRAPYLVAATLCALALLPVMADATPLYAVRSAHRCDTCHVEPSGWANPPEPERLCTLSCKGCHVSPTGGGQRTPSGRFYGREVLPTFGPRPSDGVPRDKYLPAGHPNEGRYSLFEGFSGWWPGEIPHRSIPDRYGDIDPNPLVDVGADLRGMVYAPLDFSDERPPVQAFPMQLDVYGMVRPSENVVLAGSAGLAGRRDGGFEDAEVGAGFLEREITDLLTIRELYAMVDNLPFGAFARAGRFQPVYGWRIPDHTSFTRRSLGFDEDRSVFGLDAGIAGNYWYGQLNFFRQGVGVWPADSQQPGYGATVTAGYRDLGWQAAANLQVLDRTRGSDEVTTGVQWALNLYPVTYLGQYDYSMSAPGGDVEAAAHSLFAYHEVDWTIFRGFLLKAKYDWMDPNVTFLDDHKHRFTSGVEWHPFMHVHLLADYRVNMKAYELDTLGNELLVQLHLWW
jgi:hypothetical protein